LNSFAEGCCSSQANRRHTAVQNAAGVAAVAPRL
jgi:hypothetical protein